MRKWTAYPEHAQEAGRREVPLDAEEVEKGAEEQGVSNHLLAILGVATLVVALVLDQLVEGLVLGADGLLGLGIQRRVVSNSIRNLLLLERRRVRLAGQLLCREGGRRGLAEGWGCCGIGGS